MAYVPKKNNKQEDNEEQIKEDAMALAVLIYDIYKENKRKEKIDNGSNI